MYLIALLGLMNAAQLLEECTPSCGTVVLSPTFGIAMLDNLGHNIRCKDADYHPWHPRAFS
jgi:hypothetical protein